MTETDDVVVLPDELITSHNGLQAMPQISPKAAEVIDTTMDSDDEEPEIKIEPLSTSTPPPTITAPPAPPAPETNHLPYLSDDLLAESVSTSQSTTCLTSTGCIPFSQCGSSTTALYITVITECSIPEDLAKDISSITATYQWTKERLALRKENEGDWEEFCRELGDACSEEGGMDTEKQKKKGGILKVGLEIKKNVWQRKGQS